MVKRWTVGVDLSDGFADVVESEAIGGKYVLASDYDALRRERDALRRVVEALEMESPQIKDEYTGREHPGPVKAEYDAYRAEFGGDDHE